MKCSLTHLRSKQPSFGFYPCVSTESVDESLMNSSGYSVLGIINLTACHQSYTVIPPEQNGRHFADDIFECFFVNEKFLVLIKISLKFVPKVPIKSNPAFGLDNGLAPNRRHAIIWTNADPIYWRIYVNSRNHGSATISRDISSAFLEI